MRSVSTERFDVLQGQVKKLVEDVLRLAEVVRDLNEAMRKAQQELAVLKATTP